MAGGGVLIKEGGVGINCSELRNAGQGSWCGRLQDPRGDGRPRADGSQDTLVIQLPADEAPAAFISSFWLLWLPGQWGLEGNSAGQLDGGGGEEGAK